MSAMTETIAKTKWCPFAHSRLIEWKVTASQTKNQIVSGPTTTNEPEPLCIASACMVWRDDERGGWCGLASKP